MLEIQESWILFLELLKIFQRLSQFNFKEKLGKRQNLIGEKVTNKWNKTLAFSWTLFFAISINFCLAHAL